MESFLKAHQYRGGFEKWVYDNIKLLRSDMDDDLEEDKFTVTVNVKDANGDAVASANCAIGDKSATTNSSGVASISNVTGGASILTVSKADYVTVNKNVRITKPMTYDIVLEAEEEDEE